MNTPDLLNLTGLVLNSVAGILLVASAPVPQRVIYMGNVEDVPPNQRKDRMTKRAYWIALRLLVLGFVLQLQRSSCAKVWSGSQVRTSEHPL